MSDDVGSQQLVDGHLCRPEQTRGSQVPQIGQARFDQAGDIDFVQTKVGQADEAFRHQFRKVGQSRIEDPRQVQ
ncbi:MAG: hypothetical protein GY708_00600 [Actinomycetia bacterium]|nr:hypothetical protein [Actinomycetes bacterium]